MMGLFHLLMVYLVAIYKCFSDVGLKDTLMQKRYSPWRFYFAYIE